MQSLDWGDLRYFLAVARTGSVARASEHLGVAYTTVARRLSTLESQVGARLFDRTPAGHVMTAAAEAVLHHAEQIEELAASFERSVKGQDQQLSGTLRLTAGDVVLNCLILPHLDEFFASYPDIELRIASSDRAVDLDLREADVAVRATYSEPPQSMVGTKVGQLKFMLFASRDYLANHPELNSSESRVLLWPAELDGHAAWLERLAPKARRGLCVDSTIVMLQALRLGLGFGGLPHFVGAQDPDLEVVLPEEHSWEDTPKVNLWLLHHPDLRTTARVRVFRNFLRDKLTEQRSLIEGEDGPP